MLTRLRERLGRPVDAAGLTALRVMVGLLFSLSAARFLWRGQIEPLLTGPSFHFRYPGLSWVPVPPDGVYPWIFGGMVVTGLLVAGGIAYRLSAAVLLLLFAWVELVDVATYLNHYWFLSLVGLLLLLLPLHHHGSFDAARGHAPTRAGQPTWVLWLLRAQVAVVYVFAGAAKLHADWLLRGEPLRTWLQVRTDLPLVGAFMDDPAVMGPMAIAMSWAGCLYDLTIPLGLAWRRTRTVAWLAVVVFHVATWALFPIGVFPWVMIAMSTVFWDPSWPRRLLRRAPVALPAAPPAAPPAALPVTGLFIAWIAVQVLLPLRSWRHPGEVRWHEQGFRFSWRVMLVEKTGMVGYRLEERGGDRRWEVAPRTELTRLQEHELSTQPDLIVQYGRHLAARWREEQGVEVAVYADSRASLNGRPAQVLVSPDVDLTGPLPEGWIRPLER